MCTAHFDTTAQKSQREEGALGAPTTTMDLSKYFYPATRHKKSLLGQRHVGYAVGTYQSLIFVI
jgi:hypothetical protein